jgi:cobalt-zinc-cadmium efflux system outer membrane protein
MRRILFLPWTFAALVLLTPAMPPLAAQQSGTLSLQKALEMAEQRNLGLLSARTRRALLPARLQIARQRPNPTVSFGAARDTPHQSLAFEQPLEFGFLRQRRLEQAQDEAGLTELEIAAIAWQVRSSTRGAYYGVVQARAETALLVKVQQGLAERLRDIAKGRFEAGVVAQLEVLRAEADVTKAQAEVQLARESEKTALSQLNALLNQPGLTSWELTGSLEDVLPPVSLDAAIQRAYDLNPDLKHLAQERKVEQSHLGLLKAERYPAPSLQFGADFNAPQEFRLGARGQVSLVLPLFSRNQGEIAESLANQRVLESKIAAARRATAANVEKAYIQLMALERQVEIYRQKLLPSARQLEALAEESYRAGKSDILFVLDAHRNVQEAEHNYLTTLAAQQSAYGNLEEAVGGPLE